MIIRRVFLDRIARGFRSHPIVTLLGPRQCGKTTLAQDYAGADTMHSFDLEKPEDNLALANPSLVLGALSGLVVLDEVQNRPDILPVLRVLVDRPDNPTRFLLLGSASPALVKTVSESLAGRTAYIDMAGFSIAEIGQEHWKTLWLRGGFPRSFLASGDEASCDWRRDYLRSLLEHDIPQLGITIPAATLRRFWTMLAHCHGQIWNQAELARSMGVAEKTAGNYLDILVGTYMVRVLRPWHENLGKRLVKSPKVYLNDSGLAHTLLGIPNEESLWSHPKVGATWEGFCLEQILARFPDAQPWFFATQAGAELDLLLEIDGKRYGFEIKLNEAPRLTRSMTVVMADLSLERLFVVYPGNRSAELEQRIGTLPIGDLPRLLL